MPIVAISFSSLALNIACVYVVDLQNMQIAMQALCVTMENISWQSTAYLWQQPFFIPWDGGYELMGS